jgi:2-polyprenyl-3-methyl-5-hydroxy-6-metoxy-1,4-benzoquinol methylase
LDNSAKNHNRNLKTAKIDTCAVCHSQDLKPILIKNGYHLTHCNKCGLIFVTDPPNEAELRTLYSPEKNYQTKYQFSPKAREQFMVHCYRNFNVFKEFSSQGVVLDVGCSIGGFLSLCTGYERVGLEINEASRKVAQNHFGLEEIYEYTLSEFHYLYPGRRFDCVTLWDVLEHLPDPNQTLEIIRQVLHPDGILFIDTPNADGLFARVSFMLRDSFGWYHPEPPHHLYQYGVSTLTQILQRHHFEVLKIVKVHASYRRKRSVVSLRSPRGWLYLLLLGPVELVSRLIGDGDLVTVVAKKVG